MRTGKRNGWIFVLFIDGMPVCDFELKSPTVYETEGEFYTPREVGLLMAYLLDPEEGEEVYDPTSGLLIKSQFVLREKKKEIKRHLKLYGQEINPFTYAMVKMNAFIHDMDADIRVGDTIRNPKFVENNRVKQFDKVVANPMWNQKFQQNVFENDPCNRFSFRIPHQIRALTGDGFNICLPL